MNLSNFNKHHKLRNEVCYLSEHDPDFNKGSGKVFYNAFQRAIDRGDFRNVPLAQSINSNEALKET